jgi:hypothetical protein
MYTKMKALKKKRTSDLCWDCGNVGVAAIDSGWTVCYVTSTNKTCVSSSLGAPRYIENDENGYTKSGAKVNNNTSRVLTSPTSVKTPPLFEKLWKTLWPASTPNLTNQYSYALEIVKKHSGMLVAVNKSKT